MKDRKVLSVGCGKRRAEEGVVRLDICSSVNPDVIWDLNRYPYPFEDSIFSEIECLDVIEHVSDVPAAMEEFQRILEPGGVVKITTPHFSCANSFVDPTHKQHLSYFSFDYFCEGNDLIYYSRARFLIVRRHIQFQGGRINRSVISRLANRYPKAYEQRWAWCFPAWFLYFELRAIK